MRLIDADRLIEHLEEIKGDMTIPVNRGTLLDIIRYIRNMPTAYDEDKVVRKLQESSHRTIAGQDPLDQMYASGAWSAYDRAIKIVRGGGTDGE